MPELDQIASAEESTPCTTNYRNLAEIPFVLGGQTFPVPPKAMRVTQSIKMDEAEIPEKSGKVRLPTGYENVEITVELEVCHEEQGQEGIVQTAQDRVRILQQLYRESPDALPKPHDIVSPLTDLVGVRQVLITKMDVGEPSGLDYHPVSLTMVEYQSIKTQLEQQAAAAEVLSDAQDEGAEHIEGDENLNEQLGYVQDQFEAGRQAGSGVEAPSDDFVGPPAVGL